MKRLLTQQNGGPGVRMGSAVTPEADAEFWLPTRRFVVGGIHPGSLVELNLPQPVRNNKTIGLVTQERV